MDSGKKVILNEFYELGCPNKFGNFNEVFLSTYSNYLGIIVTSNGGKKVKDDDLFLNEKDKERFYYMLQRRQFFCEAICQRFNLPKNVTFRNEIVNDKIGKHRTKNFYCIDEKGNERKFTFSNGLVVDLNTFNAFYLDENKMVDMELVNGARVGFDFKQNKLFVGENENELNVCDSTENEKKLFETMINGSKVKDVFNKNGYNNFLTQNQQQQNCSTEQAPAVPMFNYCQNMGFYQNYSNNFNNFCNIYNQFYGNNSYGYCMNRFRQKVRNVNMRNYIQFKKQFQKNYLKQNNFNGLNNNCRNNNINRNIHNYDNIGVVNQHYVDRMKKSNNLLVHQQFIMNKEREKMKLKGLQQQSDVNNSKQTLYDSLKNCNQNLDNSSLLSKNSEISSVMDFSFDKR